MLKFDSVCCIQTCLGDPCDIQTREVRCNDPANTCTLTSKPATERQCSNITCGTWQAAPWTKVKQISHLLALVMDLG